MRKLTVILALLLTAAFSARADFELRQETTNTGAVTYVVAQDPNLDRLLAQRLGTEDALILLHSGAEITGESDIYIFEKDGVRYASVRFAQQGKIRFGRYGQVTQTLLINLTEGTEASLDSIVSDVDGLASALDLYVEEIVLPQLNTYLDASELLPVPLETIHFDQDGLTVHYPADRFSFFSGNSGAVEIKYFELGDVFDAVASLREGDILFHGAQGVLPGVWEASLDMTLEAVLDAFGGLNESDFITDGEMYEVEAPSLRGVRFIVERDAAPEEKLKAIRSQRVNMQGLKTGVSLRGECVLKLGEPEKSMTLDAAAAENFRVPEGRVDTYAAGAYTLKLYYDCNDVLNAAEISR